MSENAQNKADKAKWISIIIAVMAAVITGLNAYVTYLSYSLNTENQKAALFSQFQNEYNSIASRFPEKTLNPDFKPMRGSGDYKKLQDYWIFCYAEWYQTKRRGQTAFVDMWDNYYSGLIANALEIPSLRYVIQDMMKSYGLKQGNVREFYSEVKNLAIINGSPLQ